MWFQKARAESLTAQLAHAVGSLRAPRSVAVRSLQLLARSRAFSGLVALRLLSRRLVPFRHGDNRCAAEFSLPPAMLVNIDVVIKTWR